MNRKNKVRGNGFKEIKEILKQVAIDIGELKESQKKTDEQLKRTDAEIAKIQKKTDEQIRETEELVNRTNKQVGELTDGWGKFVEGLVAPSVPKLFSKMGIKITETYPRPKSHRNGKEMELDILCEGKRKDGSEAVIVVEVSSNLGIREIDDCLGKLKNFFAFFKRYQGLDLIGVVGGVKLAKGVVGYAEKHGLYILAPSGETMVVLNRKGFKPRIWR